MLFKSRSRSASRRHEPSQRRARRRLARFENLEHRRLLASVPTGLPIAEWSQVQLESVNVSTNTEFKPQSKVWEYEDNWFAVFAESSGTWVYKLDGTSWQQEILLTTESGTKADVKAVGDLVYVLLFNGQQSQVTTVEYSSQLGGYQPWSVRPEPIDIQLGSGVEAATLDVDTTGRLWVASDATDTVEVRYADFAASSFSGPIVVGTGITNDDISTIAALPDGTIGVFWSDQNAEQFGFRVHVDGTDPTLWEADEIPAADTTGGGVADDHMNLAVGSDGTLYVAIKTSFDSSSQPLIGLLIRRPNGQWDPLYEVDTSGTRPNVLINELENRLIVVYSSSTGGSKIVMRETMLDTIAFGEKIDLLSGTNTTSTSETFTDELVVFASKNGNAVSKLLKSNSIPVPPEVNQPPVVSAGGDQTIQISGSATLAGSASDDGLPNPPAQVSSTWSVLSGPGIVSFANPAGLQTTATFSQTGTYVLQLTSSDGELSSSDTMTVTVLLDLPPSESVTAVFQDGVNGYQGTRDTFLTASNANAPHGTATSLKFDGSPDKSVLIKWDISSVPSGSQVTDATLTLNATNRSKQDYALYELMREWTEAGATWNEAVDGSDWQSSGAQGSLDRGSNSLGTVIARSTGTFTVALNADGLAAVQGWIDDPASNRGLIIQDYQSGTDAVYVSSREASNVNDRPQLEITYSTNGESEPPDVNQPPVVSAGGDQSIEVSQSASLDGGASDDGLPNPPAQVSSTWSVLSGPGTVNFGNPAAVQTSVTFSQTGTYVLQLTSSDGELSASDTMTVVVVADPLPDVNQPPVVSAGGDQTIQISESATLAGSASDDGLPNPPAQVSSSWSVLSGPGIVSFANPAGLQTTATFSQTGTYVLQLTSSDGELSSSDTMTVTVQQDTPTTLDTGLVGHWQFDTAGPVLADASSLGNDAAVVGNPTTTSGPINSALLLDGNDYAVVADDPSLDSPTAITLATWIRPERKATQYVIKKADANNTDGFELSLSSKGKVFVRFNQKSSGNTYRLDSTSKYPKAGNDWMHVVATYDGSTIRMYINGVLESSSNANFEISSNSRDLYLGSGDGGYREMSGGIDDVRIYNRALTDAEVLQLATP